MGEGVSTWVSLRFRLDGEKCFNSDGKTEPLAVPFDVRDDGIRKYRGHSRWDPADVEAEPDAQWEAIYNEKGVCLEINRTFDPPQYILRVAKKEA